MTAILPNPFGGDDTPADYLSDQSRAIVTPTTYFVPQYVAADDEHRFQLDVDLFCADIGLDPLPIFLQSRAP